MLGNRSAFSLCGAALLLMAAAWLAPTNAEKQKLILYGPSGPSPAITEAATAFSQRNDLDVEVRSGPIDSWLDQASREADLIYSSAEFMMSRLLRDQSLRLLPETVAPLYIRPSVLLVRPENPKNVLDFPDLLKPGMRVMVVEGSGQTGLWEDMAGKLGSLYTLRALRKNIVYFAPTSDDAMLAWKERDDIDAWITWNIWHMPLRDRAKLIPVSSDFRIYRQCSIAITARGATKPFSSLFVDFLTSPEGAEIFSSWGWMGLDNDAKPIAYSTDICAVCRIDNDVRVGGVGQGLLDVRSLLYEYERLGIPASELHISAVFEGDAAHWLLRDGPYAAWNEGAESNPNKALVEELRNLGVSLEICALSMERRGWKKQDLLPGVLVVPGAHVRIIDLELQGYAYIRL